MALDTAMLSSIANESRGLAMDAVVACNSGHLGLPLGAAELGAVLFGEVLQCYPEQPQWLNRDRFVLSAGHGSMFLYSWLHLAGYGVDLNEIKNFRKKGSLTPGHPEFHDTPGVEATTGPLGQGVGNAVGYAISQKLLQARFAGLDALLDYHIFALAGDGCLQEGVAFESIALAGHLGLDNLIVFYDSNDVTLNAMADKTQGGDVQKRFKTFNWDVIELPDGHDIEAINKAIRRAKRSDNARPKLVILKTEIGRGIPEVAGTQKAHGEAGAKFVEQARKALGLPQPFYVSDATHAFFKKQTTKRKRAYNRWVQRFDEWKGEHPEAAESLLEAQGGGLDAESLSGMIPEFEPKAVATRAAGETALNHLANAIPYIVSGSADLHGSTKNYIKDGEDFSAENRKGRNFHFGIREHGMGAVLNGMAYDGIFRASGATFLTFSDYMRPSVRLAALSKLQVAYIWTHDSIGVGEDGPTHQPVEHVAALRAIPNLDVVRPADAEETAGAFMASLERSDGPTALILSRQNLPNIDEVEPMARREGVLKGGYIVKEASKALQLVLLGTGSELQLCLAAANRLGGGVRVVSMPCLERFERQDEAYQSSVLGDKSTPRIAIEAGVSQPWYRYAGCKSRIIAVDRFGLSAPGAEVFETLGITTEALVKAGTSLQFAAWLAE